MTMMFFMSGVVSYFLILIIFIHLALWHWLITCRKMANGKSQHHAMSLLGAKCVYYWQVFYRYPSSDGEVSLVSKFFYQFYCCFFNTVLIFQNFASYWDTYIISHLFYLRYLIFDIKQNLNFWDNKGYNL